MEKNAVGEKPLALSRPIAFSRVSLKDKAVFSKNLSIMLKAGLSISEALDICEEQAAGKLKRTISAVARSVESGNTLSSAMASHPDVFSELFINTVKGGEASGNLENNLGYLADALTRKRELYAKIREAMFYPGIILLLSVGLGFIISFVVLPKIMPIFNGLDIELPWSTRFLIFMTDFLGDHGLETAVFFIALVALAAWLAKQKFAAPILHYLYLRIPIIGRIVKNKNLALFTGTLSTLLKSGLSLDEALAVTKNTLSNHYYRKSLADVVGIVRDGNKLSFGLEGYRRYYPTMTVSLIRIGEKSGKLEEELASLSVIYETEVDNAIKLLSAAVEPALLIIIGGLVGGLALSIMTPIYQLTGNIMR